MVKLVWLLEQPFGRVERFKIRVRHMSRAGWPRGRDHCAREFGIATLVIHACVAVRGWPWLPLAWLWLGYRWPRRAMMKPLPALSPRSRVHHAASWCYRPTSCHAAIACHRCSRFPAHYPAALPPPPFSSLLPIDALAPARPPRS